MRIEGAARRNTSSRNLCLDFALAAVSLYASCMLVPGRAGVDRGLEMVTRLLPLLLCIRLGVFWLRGLYRHPWRDTSLPHALALVEGVVISAGIGAAVARWAAGPDVTLSFFIVDAALVTVLAGATRLAPTLLDGIEAAPTATLAVSSGQWGSQLPTSAPPRVGPTGSTGETAA